MKKEKILYVVVPCYNEEEVLEETNKRLIEKLNSLMNNKTISKKSKIMYVNDGSKDKTWEIIEKLHKENKIVTGVKLSRNRGHQNALLAGLMTAKEYADVVISMDADLQDDINAVDEMLEKYYAGNEIVYGKRKKRDGESVFKLMTAKMFYKTLNALSDVDIPKDTGDFRLVDRKVVDVMNSLPEHNKFLRGLWSWIGFKQLAFEYERKERFAGKTKYPLKKMLKLASDGIISFSTKPLKMVGLLGIVSIVISIVILIYALISYFCNLNHLSAGWTSLMCAITFFAGVQLLSLWIISEYIGRIYDETKGRPQYIIDKKINTKEK